MLDSDLHRCVARSQQELAYFRIGLALHRLAVDRENAVAVTQSGTRGRRFREGGADECIDVRAFAKVFDSCPDSEVLRTLFGAERGVFDRVEVSRVWVEHAQHTAD